MVLSWLRRKSFGTNPALITSEKTWSYSELWQEVDRAAARLRDAGAGTNSVVAIVAPASPHQIFGYLGALSCGAIAAPLPYVSSPHEREAQLELLSPNHLWTTRKFVSEFAGVLQYPFASVHFEDGCDERNYSSSPGVEFLSGTACLMLTSGTTGSPSAVVVTHQNLVSNTHAIVQALKLSPFDRALWNLPLAYCFGASVLLTHLASGGRLLIESASPLELPSMVERTNPTVFYGVPSTYRWLIRENLFEKLRSPSLRIAAQAGGGLELEHQTFLVDNRIPLTVMYGQTEATARISVLPADRWNEHRGTVGFPISDTTLQIRDEEGNILAPGEEGFVYVSGNGVCAGYVSEKIRTQKTFTKHGLFTGDQGIVDERGALTILGRKSDFFKVGGIRVSASEIEGVLRGIPGVADALVVGEKHRLLGSIPVAHLEVGDNIGPSLADVSGHCRRVLDPAKVPRRIKVYSRFPRTLSGKIRRSTFTMQTF